MNIIIDDNAEGTKKLLNVFAFVRGNSANVDILKRLVIVKARKYIDWWNFSRKRIKIRMKKRVEYILLIKHTALLKCLKGSKRTLI